MTRPPSSIYSIPHRESRRKIENCINRGSHPRSEPVPVFFRADDIGIPSRQFQLLVDCFIKHRMPLCLATVPSWITPRRFIELKQVTGVNSTQWCWHQHGRLHHNFEQNGKKQEFGPSRTEEEIKNSLKKGKQRLEEILADEFQLFFTPPWNRCSETTINSLVELKFSALSRSRGARPETVPELPDFQIGVDLHTRKEISPYLGFNNLTIELEENIRSGQCGIMIHHQRMNNRAFELLDLLLGIIKSSPRLTPVLFRDLLETPV
jgi:hypothetical protein